MTQTLELVPALSRTDLLAEPVAAALRGLDAGLDAGLDTGLDTGLDAGPTAGPITGSIAGPITGSITGSIAGRIAVAEIDPELADTAAFCERYGVALDESANCVVIAGRRDGELRHLACLVLATTRADVNGIARRRLDVRKASFAPMDEAVAATGMEYGGITPIGLPAGWPVLVDAAVAAAPSVIIGSGVRRSKLRLPGSVLAGLPGVEVVDGLGR